MFACITVCVCVHNNYVITVDIAANRVTDVREVLNYYKSFEGKSILEVFRGN